MADETGAEATMTEAEVTLALTRIWQTELGIPVGPADSFFDLDGDSFVAVRIVTRMLNELGCEISLIDFFDRPTIEELVPIAARAMARAQHASAASALQKSQ
jgi:acyl carrier protein